MEVIAVTANSGYDANTGEQDEETEKELPGTVTLLVTPEQGKALAELEAEGKLHLALVYRGAKEQAEQFIRAQEAVLSELYAPYETEEEVDSTSEETENAPEAVEETNTESENGVE